MSEFCDVNGSIIEIYIASRASAPMQRVEEVRAIEQCGLREDRYCTRAGYWTDMDECQVTLIASEDIEVIARTTGIAIGNGEHRRNLVTRGVVLQSLVHKRFAIGEAVLEFDRPRPPCAYIESITEPGMVKALARRGGICARVLVGGRIRVMDDVRVL